MVDNDDLITEGAKRNRTYDLSTKNKTINKTALTSNQ